ncbi:hypothetical protein EMIT0196MI5_130063 [Pseudomonas sp. IT-196MI5]
MTENAQSIINRGSCIALYGGWEQPRVIFREGECWTLNWGHLFQRPQSMPSDMPPGISSSGSV